MTNDTRYLLTAANIKKLLQKDAYYVTVGAMLKKVVLRDTGKLHAAAETAEALSNESVQDGQEVTVVTVVAESFTRDGKLISKVEGCPCPPCKGLNNLDFENNK